MKQQQQKISQIIKKACLSSNGLVLRLTPQLGELVEDYASELNLAHVRVEKIKAQGHEALWFTKKPIAVLEEACVAENLVTTKELMDKIEELEAEIEQLKKPAPLYATKPLPSTRDRHDRTPLTRRSDKELAKECVMTEKDFKRLTDKIYRQACKQKSSGQRNKIWFERINSVGFFESLLNSEVRRHRNLHYIRLYAVAESLIVRGVNLKVEHIVCIKGSAGPSLEFK